MLMATEFGCMKNSILQRAHLGTQRTKLRRLVRMTVSISSGMRTWRSFTTEEFCKAAERHGLTVNFGVAKTEALPVLGEACKNKVKGEIKGKNFIVRVSRQELRIVEQYKHIGSMCAPSGAMGPKVSWRVNRTRVAYLAEAGRFFAAAKFSLKCKKNVAATLPETRLAVGTRQMRWTRKAVKRHCGEGCSETDAQIRAEFSIATVESKIRCRRLGFLAQLQKASSMLRAVLQEGGTRLPWVMAIIGDLVALQAAQPKVSAMPHPAGDVDVWIRMAVENRVSWRQLVQPVLTHLGAPALETAVTVPCPDYHKYCLIKGLGAHSARVHGVFRLARTVVDRSRICPVCGLFFHTRQRVIHHIEHSCESCKAAVQAGIVQSLPEAQVLARGMEVSLQVFQVFPLPCWIVFCGVSLVAGRRPFALWAYPLWGPRVSVAPHSRCVSLVALRPLVLGSERADELSLGPVVSDGFSVPCVQAKVLCPLGTFL